MNNSVPPVSKDISPARRLLRGLVADFLAVLVLVAIFLSGHL